MSMLREPTAPSLKPLGWSLTLLLAALLTTGCRSTSYTAAQLPPQFRQTTSKNANPIDLSRVALAGSSQSVIAPTDLLEVTLTTGRENERPKPISTRVAEDGTINLPIIGLVTVAGMEALDASQNITQLAIQRGMYLHPHVTVEIKAKSVNRVAVFGAVKEPGVHELPRGNCDLLSVLAAAGGLTEDADTLIEIVRQPSATSSLHASQEPTPTTPQPDEKQNGEVQLAAYQRLARPPAPNAFPQQPTVPNSQTVRIDLSKNPFNGNTDYRLSDRDVVRVVRRQKEVVHISGLVTRPGQFEIPHQQDIHLLDVVALAGGLSSPIADKVIVIRRIENNPEPLVIKASLRKAKTNGLENLRLAAGDTISVEQTPETVIVDVFTKLIRFSVGVAGRATLF